MRVRPSSDSVRKPYGNSYSQQRSLRTHRQEVTAFQSAAPSGFSANRPRRSPHVREPTAHPHSGAAKCRTRVNFWVSPECLLVRDDVGQRSINTPAGRSPCERRPISEGTCLVVPFSRAGFAIKSAAQRSRDVARTGASPTTRTVTPSHGLDSEHAALGGATPEASRLET